MKINTLKNIALPALLKANITPLLIGHKGIGKTEAVRQLCKDNNYGLIEWRLGQLADAGDIVGLAEIDRDASNRAIATRYIMPQILAQFNDGKREFIIFLDELNRATKDLLQAAFELVYDGSISANGFTLNGKGHVICAMNPAVEGYDVLDFQDVAFSGRFCQIKVEASPGDWLTYARAANINPNIINYIETNPSALSSDMADFNLNTSYDPRTWTRVGKLEQFVIDKDVFFEMIQGMVGLEQALGYREFLKSTEIITADNVLNEYPKYRDKVKTYMVVSEENSRLDAANNIVVGLVSILTNLRDERVKGDALNKSSNSTHILSESQRKNLIAFLIDLPSDMSENMIRELLCLPEIVCPSDDIDIEQNTFLDGYVLTDRALCEKLAESRGVDLDKLVKDKLD